MVSDSDSRPGRGGRVAAQQRDAKLRLILCKARGKAGKPGVRRVLGRRDRHQIGQRRRPLGGQVGKIHPQQLAPDQVRRIIRQEMHAGDHRIDRQHQFAARRRGQNGGIVLEVERTRPRKRAEMPGNQVELGEG